jgi:cytochrome P450
VSTVTGRHSDAEVELDPYSEAFFQDPHPIYRRLRDEAPVYFNPTYGFWALSRYEDVRPAMGDFETYSSAYGVTLDMVLDPEQRGRAGQMIIMMDPPAHNRMRKLVSRVFTPRAIMGLEPMVREIIHRHLAEVDPAGFDVVEDFTSRFPIEVITTMLGVPAQDREQLRRWLALPLERTPGQSGISAEARDAGVAAGMYYYQLIQERRARPADDMISRLIEAEVEREDGTRTRLDDAEIAGFVSLLGGAGAETVAKVVGGAMELFGRHPDQWRALCEDPGLIPGAFEELLRYDGPVQYDVRYTLRDVTLHGRTIPRHSPVLMLLASATRDERAEPDADRFDVRRPKPAHNLGFGYGIHSCLGSSLARMEARIALEALTRLLPHYEVDRGGLRRAMATNVAGWANVPVRRVRG